MKKIYVILLTVTIVMGSLMNPISNVNICKGIMDAKHDINYSIHRDRYYDYEKGENIEKISGLCLYYKGITIFKIFKI